MNGSLELSNKDILLLQDKGNYLIISKRYGSRFFGFFVQNNHYTIKILDRILNKNFLEKEIKKIELLNVNYGKIEYYDSSYEIFYIKDNLLYYESSELSDIEIYFDIKHIYDTSEWGRIYNVYNEKDSLIVKFNKDDLNVNIYIKDFIDYTMKNEWIKVIYNYDIIRKSPPFERYLYSPFILRAKRLRIYLNENTLDLIPERQQSLFQIAKNRLKSFVGKWITTGVPWYFQEWTRDILISLRGFYIIGEKNIVRNKLLEYSNLFLENGKLRNITNDNNGNIDGLGLFSKRFFEFIDLFNEEEKNKILDVIERNLRKYEENYLDEKKFLFYSYPNESWMDTLDRRYPIELQFLMANIYDNLYKYRKNDEYLDKLKRLKESIRKYYVEDNSLIDDLENRSIRPNIFLSYYIYPNVFNDNEWEKFFDHSLYHLWLDWGGLSSISKFDSRFIDENNGDNFFNDKGKSMHNGDSWIFLNNIAGICMKRLKYEKYRKYIEKILSANSILFANIGTLPELSSAKELKPAGALSQLWSISTFIELIDEISKKE